MEQSEQWEEGDRTIEFVSNHTDQREAIEFTDGNGFKFKNGTYTENSAEFMYTGMNDVFNRTDTKLFHWAVSSNPRQKDKGLDKNARTIVMNGIRCIGGCNKAVEAKKLGAAVMWSDKNSWPNK